MVSFLRTSSLGSGSKRSSYSRSFDLPDDSRDHGFVGGAMLPVFLNDLRRNSNNTEQNLVEVTLELDDNSIVLYSVEPAGGGGSGGGGRERERERNSELVSPQNSYGFLSRSSSAIKRKLSSWLKSPASSSRASSEVGDQCSTTLAVDKREEMKMKTKLMRTKSSAQRALKGLRFISKTTGDCDATELWRKVEERFNSLAEDGLLSREDFGECIGNHRRQYQSTTRYA